MTLGFDINPGYEKFVEAFLFFLFKESDFFVRKITFPESQFLYFSMRELSETIINEDII